MDPKEGNSRRLRCVEDGSGGGYANGEILAGRKGGLCLVSFESLDAWWRYLDVCWEDIRWLIFITLPVLDSDLTDQALLNKDHEVMLRMLNRAWHRALKKDHAQLTPGFQ